VVVDIETEPTSHDTAGSNEIPCSSDQMEDQIPALCPRDDDDSDDDSSVDETDDDEGDDVVVDNASVRPSFPHLRGGTRSKSKKSQSSSRSRKQQKRHDSRELFQRGGMENGGNYCYVNSAVQTLVAFADFVCDLNNFCIKHAARHDIPLSRAFISIARILAKKGVASPVPLKKEIDKLTDQFRGDDQHDSAEFLDALLTELHKEICRVKVLVEIDPNANLDDLDYDSVDTIVTDHFLVKTQEYGVCLSCNQRR
jgi:hypothetical protein